MKIDLTSPINWPAWRIVNPDGLMVALLLAPNPNGAKKSAIRLKLVNRWPKGWTVELVPKHYVYGDCAPDRQLSKGGQSHWETFSVGVFELLLKADGKGLKPGPVKVRVQGRTDNPAPVFTKAKEIAEALDNGNYTGPKSVVVK